MRHGDLRGPLLRKMSRQVEVGRETTLNPQLLAEVVREAGHDCRLHLLHARREAHVLWGHTLELSAMARPISHSSRANSKIRLVAYEACKARSPVELADPAALHLRAHASTTPVEDPRAAEKVEALRPRGMRHRSAVAIRVAQ